MKYRVIEDLDAPPEQRYVVESTIYGHTWGRRSFFADQLSAEIEMERLAAGPRVIAVAHFVPTGRPGADT